MAEFLTFLGQHDAGIYVVLICLATLVVLVQWLAWIFNFGRFRSQELELQTGTSVVNSGIRHVIADLFVKVIDDFRHLLALIIVLMFALALAYVLFKSSNIADVKDALQAVASSLGGIIGVIIGYYFGESAAKAGPKPQDMPLINSDAEQEEPTGSTEEIRAAPPPPDR